MSFNMTTATSRFRLARLFAFYSLGAVLASCGSEGSGPAAGAPPGGMPPMPVEIVSLEAKPVEQTTEFVSSLKSRRSSTIQPEVEGFVTRVAVRSGQNVSRGTLLFEID